DLYRLCEADRITEEVVAGHLDLSEGHAALRALQRDFSVRGHLHKVMGFGLAAAGVAGLLRLPWLDIVTAGLIGLVVGLLDWYAGKRPQLKEAGEAVAAIVASTVAIAVASFVGPLNLNTVVIASVIVLLPGLALTNAF